MFDVILGIVYSVCGITKRKTGMARHDPRREVLLVYLITSLAAPFILLLGLLDVLGILEFPFGAAEPGIVGLLGLALMLAILLAAFWVLLGWPYYILTVIRFRREPRTILPSLLFLAAEIPVLWIVLGRDRLLADLAAGSLFLAYCVAAFWVAVPDLRQKRGPSSPDTAAAERDGSGRCPR